jgi:hypothetical protein
MNEAERVAAAREAFEKAFAEALAAYWTRRGEVLTQRALDAAGVIFEEAKTVAWDAYDAALQEAER